MPVAPVQLPEELADDPQVLADDMLRELENPITGPQRVVGPTVKMSLTPTSATRASPVLGAHTAEILREFGIEEPELTVRTGEGVAFATTDSSVASLHRAIS